MSDDTTPDKQDDATSSEDTEWGSPIRIRKGTRRRLEGLVSLLTSHPGIAGLPADVKLAFDQAFSISRASFSPDVLIDTAVASLKNMLTEVPPLAMHLKEVEEQLTQARDELDQIRNSPTSDLSSSPGKKKARR